MRGRFGVPESNSYIYSGPAYIIVYYIPLDNQGKGLFVNISYMKIHKELV